MSKYLDLLLKNLLQKTFEPTSYDPDENVALSCTFAICALLECSANDARVVVSNFFSNIYDALESTTNASNFKSKEIQQHYQSYIASVVESAIISGKIQLNKIQTKAIMDLLIKTFQVRSCVYEEGLMAISSIALSNFILNS